MISWFYFSFKFQISVPVCCEVAIETNKIIFASFISLFYQQLFIPDQKYNTQSSKIFKFLKFSSMRGHHLLNTSAIGYWCRPFKMKASRFRLMKPHFDATVKKDRFRIWFDWLNIWNIPDHIIWHKEDATYQDHLQIPFSDPVYRSLNLNEMQPGYEKTTLTLTCRSVSIPSN